MKVDLRIKCDEGEYTGDVTPDRVVCLQKGAGRSNGGAGRASSRIGAREIESGRYPGLNLAGTGGAETGLGGGKSSGSSLSS